MVHWVSDRKERAAGWKMFRPEINVTDTPARRSINCLMAHREIVGEVVQEIKPRIHFRIAYRV